jgi:hypothetical protein
MVICQKYSHIVQMGLPLNARRRKEPFALSRLHVRDAGFFRAANPSTRAGYSHEEVLTTVNNDSGKDTARKPDPGCDPRFLDWIRRTIELRFQEQIAE